MELPNTSKSSPADSKDQISSSRTPRGALQQPPKTEFRAPEHLEELSSSLPGPNPELPNISRSCQAACKERISSSQASKPGGRKQANQRKASKRTTEQASKQSNEQTRKRANEQASKRAIRHTTKRTNKQSSKQEVGGVPRRACNCPPCIGFLPHYQRTNSDFHNVGFRRAITHRSAASFQALVLQGLHDYPSQGPEFLQPSDCLPQVGDRVTWVEPDL
ncbi:hypothetical protein N9L68_01155 [bacterium]|nr:hypothetical protein [bacterium]